MFRGHIYTFLRILSPLDVKGTLRKTVENVKQKGQIILCHSKTCSGGSVGQAEGIPLVGVDLYMINPIFPLWLQMP